MNNLEFIRQSVIRDMSEGVMTVGLDGKIVDINPAAAGILEKSADELTGKPFAAAFFEYEQNDAFNQTVLDAVYEADREHKNIVPYYTGERTKQVSITTSYLHDGGRKIAVIAVLSDVTELYELRDALKAMEKIRALNSQLELRNKLLNETFGRYLSDEIVRGLLETPDGLALGGKKREVTIMMSDLRGFTAMSEKTDAQRLVTMLNHYLGEMTEIIQKYGGTIIEFMGDGIFAIFGAPIECLNHAAQAVAAALEMQIKMSDVNEWNAANGYPELEMGIGINTGAVIVGNIGSEKRTKYGVCGSNVNLCGRIESYTTGGQIIISPTTRAAINEELKIDAEFTVKPKGVDEPITLSRIAGIGEPYSLSFSLNDEPPALLEKPVKTVFYMLDGKHTSDVPNVGYFTAVSSKEAILKSELNLNVYDNLSFGDVDKFFGKVVEICEDGYRVRFTSK